MPDEAVGLLLCRDLIFTSKVTGTARALGRTVLVASQGGQALTVLGERRPAAVFVDLAAGELVAGPALRALIEAAAPGTPFVAFGSHVDVQALDAARAAGCTLVLPRSRFSSELPAIIERFLERGPSEPEGRAEGSGAPGPVGA